MSVEWFCESRPLSARTKIMRRGNGFFNAEQGTSFISPFSCGPLFLNKVVLHHSASFVAYQPSKISTSATRSLSRSFTRSLNQRRQCTHYGGRGAAWTAQMNSDDKNSDIEQTNSAKVNGDDANVVTGEDTDVSDLSLPDLKQLFSSEGEPGCVQCEGKGEVVCPICMGKGYFSLTMMDTTSATTCRMCRGRRIIPCPTCREIVFKSIMWWDQIPSEEQDPSEEWRDGPDGPRISWGEPPVSS